MRKLIPVLLLLAVVFPAEAQYSYWKQYRYEFQYGLGTTSFLGDLGGGAREPARFLGLRDLDMAGTRPLIHGAMRYKILEILALKLSLSGGLISSKDLYTKEAGRLNRGMHFRTFAFEPSVHVEFYILKDRGKRFISQQPNFFNNVSIYMFTGFGAVFFNPQAKYEGDWVGLRNLRTEGQGLPKYVYTDANNTKYIYEGWQAAGTIDELKALAGDTATYNRQPYKRIAAAIPVGIGFKYSISRRQAVSLEIGNRYTSTDYMDDVSGSYYDNATLTNVMGTAAAHFADPHEYLDDFNGDGVKDGWKPIPHGASYRGNSKYKDAYIFLTISYVYKLKTSRKGLPKFN